jgi:hypothetical protein
MNKNKDNTQYTYCAGFQGKSKNSVLFDRGLSCTHRQRAFPEICHVLWETMHESKHNHVHKKNTSCLKVDQKLTMI